MFNSPIIFFGQRNDLSYSSKIIIGIKSNLFVKRETFSSNLLVFNLTKVPIIDKPLSTIFYAQTDKVTALITKTSPVSTSKTLKSKIPFRMHHLSKNDILTSPFGMSLLAFLRLHRISNPKDGRLYERNYTTNEEEPEFDYTLWTDDSINAYIDDLRDAASKIKNSTYKTTTKTSLLSLLNSNNTTVSKKISTVKPVDLNAKTKIKTSLLSLLNFNNTTVSKKISTVKPVELNAEHQLEFYKILDLQLPISEMTDVIRLYVLYEFGGVYMDMDMMVVNSITSFLQNGYPCVISEEHPIQV